MGWYQVELAIHETFLVETEAEDAGEALKRAYDHASRRTFSASCFSVEKRMRIPEEELKDYEPEEGRIL